MKIFRRIVSICLIAFILLSAIIPVNTNAISERSIDIPYEYTCVPGTEAWNRCSTHDERCRMNDISDSDLELLTTNALVRTIVKYPFLSDLFAFSSYRIGYEACRDVWNFLRILENREDAFLELHNIYLDKNNGLDPIQIECLSLIMLYGDFKFDEDQLSLKNELINNITSCNRLLN
ncbi:MAG: hypothetical protein K6G45_09825 [Lachnospiraceae bacterium]|nr:hypothetical protein [Lachnospiraceae bacterium]